MGECPKSVTVHDSGRDGRCVWCGQRVEAPVPAPDHYPVSELTEAYAYHYGVDDPEEPVSYGRSVWP